jgi:hypothetical protein
MRILLGGEGRKGGADQVWVLYTGGRGRESGLERGPRARVVVSKQEDYLSGSVVLLVEEEVSERPLV